jgi:hypothetical protein
MPDIAWTPVRSSNIKRVGRCPDGHLYVEFHRVAGGGPGIYRYPGAADQHHGALTRDDSPGRYVRGISVKGEKL